VSLGQRNGSPLSLISGTSGKLEETRNLSVYSSNVPTSSFCRYCLYFTAAGQYSCRHLSRAVSVISICACLSFSNAVAYMIGFVTETAGVSR
jgi:hypothetical protein